jgi:hypothetical protein
MELSVSLHRVREVNQLSPRWQKMPPAVQPSAAIIECPTNFLSVSPAHHGRKGVFFSKSSGKAPAKRATNLASNAGIEQHVYIALSGFSTKLHVVFAVNSNCEWGVFRANCGKRMVFWLAKADR